MKRSITPTILVLALLLFCIPLSAAPWWGGYRIGLDGFDVPSISQEEHWSVTFIAEPITALLSGPSVQFGLTMPSFPFTDSHTYLSVGVGTSLFALQEHPFDRSFRRDSAYTPRIDVLFLFDVQETSFTATSILLQPISFHFGDKQIGILGVHLVKDHQVDTWGWGIRLFEIVHYLW